MLNNTNKMTKKNIQDMLNKSRNSKLGVNIFKAFVVGGQYV